ncbi:MAG: DUF1015 domain-containing protein [Treponema sp.]|nr:DUF1015 domain-containing protein [Treponema sp.]
MKKIQELGIHIPHILLPKNIDVSSWSVIACDQYTQNQEYWNKAAHIAENKPSTLHIILPEVYLSDKNKQERISAIRTTMRTYLKNGIFEPAKQECMYIERKTAYNRLRHGLLVALDLETYEWKPFSKALVRATEATIVERIPPRMEIRRGAPLETPHIMLLVNDPQKILVEKIGSMIKESNKAPAYSGTLMLNGGEITGWPVSQPQEIAYLEQALNTIAEQNTDTNGDTFLFAVGDGNHSLATAKSIWEEYKKQNNTSDSPVRYALVEIVNIFDSGLTFEPIHRALFSTNGSRLVTYLKEKLSAQCEVKNSPEALSQAIHNSKADFGFIFTEHDTTQYIQLKTDITDLAVSHLQPLLDEYLSAHPDSSIDYIHGTQDTCQLGTQQDTVAILLPPVAKDSFFTTINTRGPLPRKSFSMGEADEKRFYLECRTLFE